MILIGVLDDFIKNSHAAIKRTTGTQEKIMKDWSLAPAGVLHRLNPNRNLWFLTKPRELTMRWQTPRETVKERESNANCG